VARAGVVHGIEMTLRCGLCGEPINECVCPGYNREAEAIEHCGPGGALASRWCRKCDSHYGWCECAHPIWVVRSEGKLYALPEEVE